MKNWHRNTILGVAILLFGAARMPFEAGLAKELRAANLMPPKLEIGTSERIGQTSSAVALGGLRTLVATFMNLRAFTFFQELKWDELADAFDTIVDLAPHTPYYWEAGSSHLVYDAASYYINQSTLPPLRRKQAWKSSVLQGKEFLERGIRNNPDDAGLLTQLGRILSNPDKFEAYPDINQSLSDASDAFARAYATGNALPFVKRARLWPLACIPGREKEALDLAHELYAEKSNRVPTLQCLVLVLEAYANPDLDIPKRTLEIFGTPEKAYDQLGDYWRSSKERFPIYGVATALASLEKTLDIPPEQGVLNKPLPPPATIDRYFNH